MVESTKPVVKSDEDDFDENSEDVGVPGEENFEVPEVTSRPKVYFILLSSVLELQVE